MNLGFVAGTHAVAVIECGYSPAMAEAMLRRIREITPLPVRYVINTNSQPHRFLGNDVFRAAAAEVLATREAAARVENEGAGFAAAATRTLELGTAMTPPRQPDRLIDAGKPVALDLGGGVSLTLTHFGRAHTRGSLVVDVVPDATPFAGDILYAGRLPSLLTDSHAGQWVAAYDALRGLQAKQFIPGHGRVGPLSAFEHSTYRCLSSLRAHMDSAVMAGQGVGQATKHFEASAWKSLTLFDEFAGRNASLTYLEAENEGF